MTSEFKKVEKPRVVLRLALAGLQDVRAEDVAAGSSAMDGDGKTIESCLRSVFAIIAEEMHAIWPSPKEPPGGSLTNVRSYYDSERKPLLRLVTGLCKGADTIAADVLHALSSDPDYQGKLEEELAAVLAFDPQTYRDSRNSEEEKRDFDRQAERCSYIFYQDGRYENDTDALDKKKPGWTKSCRARAYRAQGSLLLRHGDILIAVCDPDDPVKGRKPGGTVETLRAALEQELPVVLLHSGTLAVSVIQPGDEPETALADAKNGDAHWQSRLRNWVGSILANPDMSPEAPAKSKAEEIERLQEYFHADYRSETLKRKKPFRAPLFLWGMKRWEHFEKRFKSEKPVPVDPPVLPYAKWRKRSTDLNYHFSDLYRSTFLSNFSLAALAVFIAALSLLAMGLFNPIMLELGDLIAGSPGHEGEPNHPSTRLLAFLLFLGLAKFACVFTIMWLTKKANKEGWNGAAVEYRFMAERLRAMFYLPRAGSVRPPKVAAPLYANQVIRQSAIDWLTDAIVRQVSPVDIKIPAVDHPRPSIEDESKFVSLCQSSEIIREGQSSYPITTLTIDPLDALERLKSDWIKGQAAYHASTSHTMHRLALFVEHWGARLSKLVVWIVGIDIALVSLELLHLLPHSIALFTPFLIFTATLLPAMVASLNGIRFQSECERLAERSKKLQVILEGRPANAENAQNQSTEIFDKSSQDPLGDMQSAADRRIENIHEARKEPQTNEQSWTTSSLRSTESVAKLLAQEVSEWKVLYAKEIPEA